MAKKKPKTKFKILPLTLSIILFLLLFLNYQFIMKDKIYPITLVGDQNVSFLRESDAKKKIEDKVKSRSQEKISFNYPKKAFTIDFSNEDLSIDLSNLDSATDARNNKTYLEIIMEQIQTLFLTKKLDLKIDLKLSKQFEQIEAEIKKIPEDAQLIFSEAEIQEGSASATTPSSSIQIKEGKFGLALDKIALEKYISGYLLTGKYPINLPTNLVPPKITTENVLRAKKALESLQKESLKLKFEGSLWVLDTKQLLTLLDLTSGENLLLDKEKTYAYLEKIASEIDQEVQEGLFEFDPGTKRVSAFKPSQDGRKLDMERTYQLLTDALISNTSKSINLPVSITKPRIQTSDVNSLGINELLGRGISHFAGSIQNRIYNVNLTASKINGILIPSGEIFSFNQTVGDITAATGFKQAYVIKAGRTVLDDGGGVCQDSTTLFRAVLNAGLPVLKRTAHAYRVGYYEQGFPPGLDATVFYPTVDFQFKNDTPAHILIQAYTSGLTLYIDLYGSSDGRVSNISKSVVTNQTPPPPELRQDDPTLPKGEVKQVDWAAWGANVTFSRTVTRAGEEIIKETWKSAYKPWQAVYLVGTKE